MSVVGKDNGERVLRVPEDELDFDEHYVFFYNAVPFTGIAFEEHAEGAYTETRFFNGLRHGIARSWDASDALEQERIFEYGVPIRETSFAPLGRPTVTYEIAEGSADWRSRQQRREMYPYWPPVQGILRPVPPAVENPPMASGWPDGKDELVRRQNELALASPGGWEGTPANIGGCWVCFPRGKPGDGHKGDPAWVAAVVFAGDEVVDAYSARTEAPAGYASGLMALREGPILEHALRQLDPLPDVLLVNATGRDHPRAAGFALHLGAALGIPTVGVTDQPLVASGEMPADEEGATSPLICEGKLVGYWLRSRKGAAPVAVSAAWRTTPEKAVEVALMAVGKNRTPEPLREARRLARELRAAYTSTEQ